MMVIQGRYNAVYLTCSQKLTDRQLSVLHVESNRKFNQKEELKISMVKFNPIQ